MAIEAGGQGVRAIGARLRAAREKCGLTVLQAAERLHVDARVLEALEAENFTMLGADVYVRGHLRRYAEAVGESSTELQELYAGACGERAPDLTRIARARKVSRPSPFLLPALLLVVGAALVGALWWFFTVSHGSGQPLEGRPALRSGESAGAAGAKVWATPGRGETLAPVTGIAAAAGALPAYGRAEARLEVRVSALSWVEITDADGRGLLEGLYAAGSSHEVRGTAPLRVVLGNAPAVDLEVNGRPVTLSGLVHRNGSAYLTIDGNGHVGAASARLAHGD